MKISSPSRSPTAELILDAAEKVFAELGYEGASMRQIAHTADITQALLHYHFQTKERLYESVFERRSTAINAERQLLLGALFAESRSPTIEDVLQTYYAPVMLGSARGNAAFAQMVSSLSLGSDGRAKALITKYYDPIAHAYIGAFKKVEPLNDAMAVWAYLLTLGARTHVSSVSKRAERLSNRKCDTGDFDTSMRVLIQFVAGGIKALSSNTMVSANATTRRKSTAKKPVAKRSGSFGRI
jgi:AcrR family transcriptional regulator